MSYNDGNSRLMVLEVPYSEKEEAKKLGARWDPDIRKWFVPTGIDPKPLAKWFPEAERASGGVQK